MTDIIGRLTFLLLIGLLAGHTRANDTPDSDHRTTPQPTPTWTMSRADAGASGAVSHTLPRSLDILWETQIAEAVETTPVSDGVRVYVTDVMGGVEALDAETGKSVWRREFDTGFVAAPGLYLPASVVDDPNISTPRIPIIVVGTNEAIKDKDSQATSNPTTNKDANFKQPLLVVGDVEGNVEAMNPETGESLWKFVTNGEINAAPSFFAVPRIEQTPPKPTDRSSDSSDIDSSNTASSDNTSSHPNNYEIRLLQTSQDGNLYCLAAHTGELIWKYETNDQIRCAASIGSGKTFLGGCDSALHIVDLATGTAAREAMPLGGPTGSTPAVTGEEVFLPIMDGVVFAFNSTSGEIRWEFEDPERLQEYRSSPAIGPDRIIVGSNNKHIDALDRNTGKRLWRTTLRRRADASPLIAGTDVWVASSDGTLLRLSLDDGTEKWSFESRGKFLAAPAILGDRLIIADDDGRIRCFATNGTDP
ncbi:outer membrane protein assembly factor BamB family protein [Rhodopirellula sallentina]|uniref:Serine/threonine protein kinase related protein n=1 Tax=Rhodopirellula sallentina SM41 TaxID=1263870 RepID=M5U761_9BACT|nr:PQQ-binding-like beta-propeller repeat protein [Rhodopirellula sallentina]EMI57124.1 serine/threonine protein kinase related protein [Rhodopirellula sallentina SM41]